MNRNRILITGGTGMLGAALVEEWKDAHDLCTISKSRHFRDVEFRLLDLAFPEDSAAVVEDFRPTHVVHAAAETDVDFCESHPDLALKINAISSGVLAAASARVGAHFTYISTESVFDGTAAPYNEIAVTAPLNAYAASKLEGERLVMEAKPDSVVIRIGLEGWRPSGRPGFVQWIVQGLRQGERRRACVDWTHTLVFASNMATILESLWSTGGSGVFHVGDVASRNNFEIALRTAEVFDLDTSLLVPIESTTLGLKAKRPSDVSLCSQRLSKSARERIWTLDAGLRAMQFDEASGLVERWRERLVA